MGHRRISNKRIKQMMNDIFPGNEEQKKGNAVLEDNKSQTGKNGKVQFEDQQK